MTVEAMRSATLSLDLRSLRWTMSVPGTLAWLVAGLAVASAFSPTLVLTLLPAVVLLLLAGGRPGEALLERLRERRRRRRAVAAVRSRPVAQRRPLVVRPRLGRRFVTEALAMRPPPAVSI